MALNKVLGSFKPDNLFAANQELPAVADTLEIAAGQFLLRGSLVNKDGVLVNANDMEVYAVLARDCDTTDGAMEVPVYLTGEFNADAVKVNDNVDNMFAVCVSARKAGIFLKPHAKMPPVPPMTLRFKFSKPGYVPSTEKGTWKKVVNGIWDWTYDNPDWSNAFLNVFRFKDNVVDVIDAGETSNVVNISYLFANTLENGDDEDYCYIRSIPLFDTSNVVYANFTFRDNVLLKEIPRFDLRKVQFAQGMFYGLSITDIPLFDYSAAPIVKRIFKNCFLAKTGILENYNAMLELGNAITNHSEAFTDCGRDTEEGQAALAQIPASWGGLAEG